MEPYSKHLDWNKFLDAKDKLNPELHQIAMNIIKLKSISVKILI